MSIVKQIQSAKKKAQNEIKKKRKDPEHALVPRDVDSDKHHTQRRRVGEYNRKIIENVKKAIVSKRKGGSYVEVHGENGDKEKTKSKRSMNDVSAYTDFSSTNEGTVIQFPGNNRRKERQVEKSSPAISTEHPFNFWHKSSIKSEKGKSLTVSSAYDHYTDHAEKFDNDPMPLEEFGKKMNEKGYSKAKIAGRVRWVDVTTTK